MDRLYIMSIKHGQKVANAPVNIASEATAVLVASAAAMSIRSRYYNDAIIVSRHMGLDVTSGGQVVASVELAPTSGRSSPFVVG